MTRLVFDIEADNLYEEASVIWCIVAKDIDNLNVSDETFLQDQITEIRRHIERSPKTQQQQLALEWIKEYAEQYRHEWRRRTFYKSVFDRR